MEEGVRKHDAFYAHEDRSKNINYVFRVVIDHLNSLAEKHVSDKFFDVGCSGDFLFAVNQL